MTLTSDCADFRLHFLRLLQEHIINVALNETFRTKRAQTYIQTIINDKWNSIDNFVVVLIKWKKKLRKKNKQKQVSTLLFSIHPYVVASYAKRTHITSHHTILSRTRGRVQCLFIFIFHWTVSFIQTLYSSTTIDLTRRLIMCAL